MANTLIFERAFVEELSDLGVRVGISPVERASQEFFRRGVIFCSDRPIILRSVIQRHIPDHDAYRRLIKGSYSEGNRSQGDWWYSLPDGYSGMRRTDGDKTRQAIEAVSAALDDYFRAKNPSHVRRIILAIGAAVCWKSPEDATGLTPVGRLLFDTQKTIASASPPPRVSRAA